MSLMILAPQKKKLASLIVSKMGKPDFVQKLGEPSKGKEMEMGEGVESDNSYACESCAQDMLAAIKEGDAKKLSMVLQDFIALASDKEDESYEMEEEDEEL